MSSLPEHDEFSTHAVPTDARVASFRVAAVASMPIHAERLHYGQRAAVIAVGAPGFYQTAEALAATEPRCFGIDLAYEALDTLVSD
jgi:hypothetical protein